MSENYSLPVNEKAYDTLAKARKTGENFSDVIMRLASTKLVGLQKRGEQVITSSDGKKISIKIEQDLCFGAESCVNLAPMVFALDVSHLGFGRKGSEPLGMMDVPEGSVTSETVVLAARSCPYRAIIVKDVESGEQLSP
ncbi:MAG: ferredoxin [Thaumarchaeota archaeon]|nr:ferredoxin [Nitrososphaerota archaeon]